MREIKFRAWDAVKQRMVFLDHLWNNHWYLQDSRAAIDNSNQEAGAQAQHGQFPVMQYTGLKDKNGTEIYEGDILKGSQYFGLGVVKPHTLNPARIVVVFEDQPRNYLFDDLVSDDAPQWEITGNIYETPNLLTNEK
jgi:hypothetical protein